MQLYRKWDTVGSLIFLPVNDPNLDELCGLFPVYKDSEFGRLILNPVVCNSRQRKASLYSKLLGQGFLIARIHIDRRAGHHAVTSSADLRECYFRFKVTPGRARRNAIGVILDADQFKDFLAYNASVAGKRVVGCLNAMAQGDSDAVEVAQAAHFGLLRRRCGGCLPSELMAYRAPILRGPSTSSSTLTTTLASRFLIPKTD